MKLNRMDNKNTKNPMKIKTTNKQFSNDRIPMNSKYLIMFNFLVIKKRTYTIIFLYQFSRYSLKEISLRSSHCGSVVMNPTSIHEDAGSIPGLVQWVMDPVLLLAVV